MNGIRQFTLSDAEQCCAVINASIATMDGLNAAARQIIAAKNTPEQLGRALAGMTTVVCEQDSAIVGLAALDGAEIKRVYVLPAAQGQGVGAQIMDALEAEAATRGLAQVTVQSSPSAVAFYRRRSYVSIGAKTLTAGPAVFEIVNMIKDLR
jgi:GNAT superfamily N-acetyltransferase